MVQPPAARDLTISGEAGVLHGEEAGEGPLVICAHGLTATRRYVLHGSRALERLGYRVLAYDARGHGESDPAANGEYGYPRLADDLAAVVADARSQGQAVVLAGHSMGTHAIAAYLLANPGAADAVCLIGPAYDGEPAGAEELARWDQLAEGLRESGVEGFMERYTQREWPEEWRETILRITRERLGLHRHPGAVADALEQVPRSQAFHDLDELESIDVPALVIASHDDADPGHPYAVAEAWAEALPKGRLISESRDESPLAWQGGRLSRAIGEFLGEVL